MEVRSSTLGADYRPINNRLERWLIFKILKFLFRTVTFEIDFLDGDIRKIGGSSTGVRIAPPRLLHLLLILRNPNFYLPQAFVDGRWYNVSGELSEFVVLSRNRKGTNTTAHGLTLGITAHLRYIYKHYVNTGALRKVKRHYNEDSRIYEALLGPSMAYSCAFFDDGTADLERAQQKKLLVTLERLRLPEDEPLSVLDIGCGWGSFIFFAAQRTGAQFEGISIASSQIEFAKRKLHQFEIADRHRIVFSCKDYLGFRADEHAVYDRIVSIGMLEHVGATQYGRFFSEVDRLLKEGGVAVVHSIVRKTLGITNTWVDRYVFPGGYIPRISEVVNGIEGTGLVLESQFRHDGTNYKKTLQAWTQKLVQNERYCLEVLREIAIAQGAPVSKSEQTARASFRLWYFYFEFMQCMFDKRGAACDVAQFVITKPTGTNV